MGLALFLSFLGSAMILGSAVAVFALLLMGEYNSKTGMPFVFAAGWFFLGVGNYIMKTPAVASEVFYVDCIDSYSWKNPTGVTKEDICIKATIDYKEKVLKL